MKTLGVLGGLGPQAGFYFCALAVDLTDAATDQENINLILTSSAETPDRTEYILDRSKPDPLPYMLRDLKRLEGAGAQIIALPCNTAHYFYDELTAASPLPIINMIAETADEIAKRGIKRAGLFATEGTVKAGLYASELSRRNVECVLPDAEVQALVNRLIFDCVKAGLPADADALAGAEEAMRKRGCEAVILGCTELGVIKRDMKLSEFYIDSMEVLAARAVELCGGKLKGRK